LKKKEKNCRRTFGFYAIRCTKYNSINAKCHAPNAATPAREWKFIFYFLVIFDSCMPHVSGWGMEDGVGFKAAEEKCSSR